MNSPAVHNKIETVAKKILRICEQARIEAWALQVDYNNWQMAVTVGHWVNACAELQIFSLLRFLTSPFGWAWNRLMFNIAAQDESYQHDDKWYCLYVTHTQGILTFFAYKVFRFLNAGELERGEKYSCCTKDARHQSVQRLPRPGCLGIHRLVSQIVQFCSPLKIWVWPRSSYKRSALCIYLLAIINESRSNKNMGIGVELSMHLHGLSLCCHTRHRAIVRCCRHELLCWSLEIWLSLMPLEGSLSLR